MTVERRSGEKPKSRRGKRGGKQRRERADLIGYGEADPSQLPLPWMPKFLAVLRRTGNVSTAAKRVKISRQNAYEHRNRHAVFGALWDDAVEDRTDVLEQALYERALYGWDEPVFGSLPGEHAGSGEVGVRRKFDNALARWIVERARPEEKDDSANEAADMAALIRGFVQAATGSVPNTKSDEAADWGAQRQGDAVIEGKGAGPREEPKPAGPPMRMRLCVECGTPVDVSAVTCPNCGADPNPPD